jgi:hypothetical protein
MKIRAPGLGVISHIILVFAWKIASSQIIRSSGRDSSQGPSEQEEELLPTPPQRSIGSCVILP